jgi:hypothetical protein
LLYARHLSFANPSAEALASIKALGLEGWIHLSPEAYRSEPPVFSDIF